MTPAVATIHLPLWQLALVLAPLLLLALAAALLRRLARPREPGDGERDWSVPELEAAGSSPIHRWEARVKLVSLLLCAFLIASLQHLLLALAALLPAGAALLLARTPWRRALLRLLALGGFLGMLLVVMPFSAPPRPGDTLLLFGDLDALAFNLRGLELAATIALKGIAIALLSEPLLATAPLPVTLQALRRLGAPEMAGQMVLLSHRYLHVFRHEARRMADGMQVRGFRRQARPAALRGLANFLGMLFVRSFERTERVCEAMQARGYRGRLPAPEEQPVTSRDLLFGAAWLMAGTALVLLDRLWR